MRSEAPERIFLGWKPLGGRPLLRQVADFLIERSDSPSALGETMVALPGARAGRRLLDHLADAARDRGWTGFFPPRVMTQGRLVDELVQLDLPAADRLTRTLAWERALVTSDKDVLLRLVRHPPARRDRAAWWRLAEDVRTLHSELSLAGHDFRSTLGELQASAIGLPASELQRWAALANVQERWREELASFGLADPHEGRRAALVAGRVRTDADVVLVGVVEVSGLLRAALDALAVPPVAVVLAPEALGERFDRYGALRSEAWAEAYSDVPLEFWRVVDSPDDQARMVLAQAASLPDLALASELAVGTLDEEVTPYLVRRFAGAGIRARDAAGTPLERTAPARLLEGLAQYLSTGTSGDLAALLRHADLSAVVEAATGHDPVARLDRYRPRHLPRRVDPRDYKEPDKVQPANSIGPLMRTLADALGALAQREPLGVPRIVDGARVFLRFVYDAHPLLVGRSDPPSVADSPERENDQRELRAALELIGAALRAMESTPAALAGQAAPADGLRLLLRTAGSLGAIAPAPRELDEPTVELLGWLELLLDDTPHLVVAGCNEGRLPAPPSQEAYLPDRVRSQLGLEDDRQRAARDTYLMAALVASRRSIAFISGRKTRDDDPLIASRLFFAVPPAEAGARLDHALAPRAFAPIEREERRPEAPPIVQACGAPDTFSVTSFRTYLDSPIRFHLERELKLETLDDRIGELDALRFGTFAHDVLERFGRSRLAASTDPEQIFEFLERQLDRAHERVLPEDALPAVPLQMEQLRLRLASFARWQAERAAEGWRIAHVEWSPGADAATGDAGKRRGAVELDIGRGAPPAWIRGKIDRIERHPDGSWCVLDYKTSHKSDDPGAKHGGSHGKPPKSKEHWKDLQLPLYAHMVRELAPTPWPPELGYVNLPGDGSAVECKLLKGFGQDVIEEALEVARDVVRAVRRREVGALGKSARLEPIVLELLGVGLVVEPTADDPDTEGGERS